MPWWFIDVQVDGLNAVDEEGQEIGGIRQARKLAHEALLDIVRERVTLDSSIECRVTVRDEARTIYAATLTGNFKLEVATGLRLTRVN